MYIGGLLMNLLSVPIANPASQRPAAHLAWLLRDGTSIDFSLRKPIGNGCLLLSYIYLEGGFPLELEPEMPPRGLVLLGF
jgi:hypothetical protein